MKAEFLVKMKKECFWHNYSQVVFIYAFLIILMAIAGLYDKVFFTLQNFNNLISVAFPFLMIAYAQTLVILTGGIDLSVGGLVCLTNVLCIVLMKPQSPQGYILSIICTLLAGCIFGGFNGLFITIGRLEPVIVTLASSAFISGLALYILPTPGGRVHSGFAMAINKSVFGIPVTLIILVIISVIIWLLMKRTSFGSAMHAIGGNEAAAYSSGVSVKRVKFMVYSLSGVLCALAGIYLAVQMYSGDPTVGKPYTMNSITAVVVGGTLMSGGRGDIIGSIAGVFIVVVINNILNLIGISSFYQYIFQGVILIVALAISSLKSKSLK